MTKQCINYIKEINTNDKLLTDYKVYNSLNMVSVMLHTIFMEPTDLLALINQIDNLLDKNSDDYQLIKDNEVDYLNLKQLANYAYKTGGYWFLDDFELVQITNLNMAKKAVNLIKND